MSFVKYTCSMNRLHKYGLLLSVPPFITKKLSIHQKINLTTIGQFFPPEIITPVPQRSKDYGLNTVYEM
jgi:hypothetical protein